MHGKRLMPALQTYPLDPHKESPNEPFRDPFINGTTSHFGSFYLHSIHPSNQLEIYWL